jgi:hypothetical protein
MRDEDRTRFYDLCYDAWRSGRDPDAVSMDRYDDFRAQGFHPDEITVPMMLPKRDPVSRDEVEFEYTANARLDRQEEAR